MKKILISNKNISSNIKLNVLVSPISAQLSDIVEYIFEIIVSKGSNVKSFQLTDMFPSDTQEFIQGSVTKNGEGLNPQINPSGGKIIFPEISEINTVTEEFKINYGFKVKINKILNENISTEIQTNNAKVDWIDGETGTSGESIMSSVNLTINKPKLSIEIGQKNITNAEEYTIQNIEFQVGDNVSYVISITNEGEGSSYNNVITDEISQYLIPNSSSINVTKGTVNITGNIFRWNIDSILPRENIKAIFNMNVKNTLPLNCSISNLSKVSYKNSFDDTNIQGPINSNTVNMNFNPISFKVLSNSIQIIKNELEYNIILDIKKGITIFNTEIYDILPIDQTYNNVATKQINNGIVENITPVLSNETDGRQKINFPQPIIGSTNNIDTTKEKLTVKYVFKVLVNNFKNSSSNSEIQINKGYFNYFTSPDSVAPEIIINNYDVLILKSSYVKILIEQKNLTKGGVVAQYSTDPIEASINDVIHYKITVFSDKSLKAYSLNMIDTLSNNLNFIRTVTNPTDGVITTPTSFNGGNLTWDIDMLNEGTNYIYEFEVQVNNNAGPGEIINNGINGTYYVDMNKVDQLNTVSNKLETNMEKIGVTITPDKLEANLGDTIQYNVKVTIPKGSKLSELIIICRKFDYTQDYLYSTNFQNYIKGSYKTDFVGGKFEENNDGFKYEIKDSSLLIVPLNENLIINLSYNTQITRINRRAKIFKCMDNFVNIYYKSINNIVNLPIVSSCNVQLIPLNITTEFYQRNVTKGDIEFTTAVLKNVDLNDTIEYKYIMINNSSINGLKFSYNISLSYIDNTYKNIIQDNVIILNSGESKTIIVKDNYTKAARGQAFVNIFEQNYVYYPEWNLIFTGDIFPVGGENGYKSIECNNYEGEFVASLFVMLGVETIGEISIPFPKGFLGENVQIENFIGKGFKYVPYSLTNEGGIEFISPETLVFPNEGVVDALTKEKHITYRFKFIAQENISWTGYLTWDIRDSNNYLIKKKVSFNYNKGILNKGIEVDLSISKDGKKFSKDAQQINLGDKFYYKISSFYPNYITFTYVYNWLPPEVIFEGVISSSYNNMSVRDIIIRNESLIYLTQSILENTTIDIVLCLKLIKPIISKDIINKCYIIYSQTFGNAVSGLIVGSNSIQITSKNLGVTINVSNNEVRVGDEITYTLDVIIFGGITIYNVVLQNILPKGQSYLGGATLNGSLIQVEQNGQNITFATQNTATEKLIYVFKAKVVSGPSSETLQEIQTNNATLNYSIDSIKGEKTPQSELANVEILVGIAKLQLTILQRNKSKQTPFSVNKIEVQLDDLIEYQIIIKNLGKGYASNTNVEITLNKTNIFTRIISNNTGSVTFDNTSYKVSWNIPKVYGDDTVKLIFETKIVEGGIAGETKQVSSILNYNTGVKVKNINGQELKQQYPYVSINKTVENHYGIVGNICKYNILVTIPKGMKCYDINVQDILPIGQNFLSTTLNGSDITPILEGKLIKFPSISLVQADKVDLVYNYELKSILESGNFITSRYDTQLNSSSIIWSLDSSNTTVEGPISDVVQVSVIINKDLKIEKYQRISSAGGEFTKNNIDIVKDEVIEYKIVVQNISSEVLYNIEIKDSLPNNLTFEAIQSKTIGDAVEVGGVITWNGITSLNPNGGTATLVFTVIGHMLGDNIPNKVNGGFALESTGPTYQKVYSNIVGTNIVSNLSNTIKIEKYQRISSAAGDFTTGNIDVVKGEIIEYKLTITNISTTKSLYNISLNDILSNDLRYIEIRSVSIGTATWHDTSGIPGKVGGTIVWTGIDILESQSVIELVMECEVIK